MRLVILLVALFSSCRELMAQNSSCCRLDVTAPKEPQTELHVVVTNVRDAPVSYFRWRAADANFRVNIVSSNGNMPILTERGELIRSGRPLNGSMQQTKPLTHGEKLNEVLDLRTLYTFKPGKYVVTVFRDVYIGEKRIELQGKTTITVP